MRRINKISALFLAAVMVVSMVLLSSCDGGNSNTTYQVKVVDAQIYEFADAQAAAVQHLYDTMVPGSLGFAEVYGIKNLVYLIHRKHLWQMLPYLSRLHQFRGVLLYFLL